MAFPIPIPDFVQQYVLDVVKEYVTNQLDYVWNYEDRVKELDTVVKKLHEDKETVRDKAEEEEDRYGREVYDHVKVWLGRVDEIINEYEAFKEEHSRHAGYPLTFANVEIRHSRSQIAEDIKQRVGELQDEKQDTISRWQGPLFMGFAFSNVDYVCFDSRKETMKKIMAALEDSSARVIGVHGPSGAGKTTLVIEAVNKARECKLFNVVIMANVTKIPDVRKIQGQIADMLGMKLEEESENARAVRIQERLKKEKENTLIILDDLWAKVDLNMVGIPTEHLTLKEGKSSAPGAHKMESKQIPGPGAMKTEKTSGGDALSKLKTEERYKGWKILLISEARQVLSQMNVKASLIFSVNSLNDKEAETLFKKMAGIGDKNSEFEKSAAEIAGKCNGLPMSIVTTARALKNQSRSVWEDTRRKLESQKLIGTPEYSTKLGYELLENEELKITFLICAQMAHDALVTDLVKYCIGLGFLQGIYTVRETRDRVQTLLMKLKQSGLLFDSYSCDRFTMQNLVRNAALSIAAEVNHVFMLIEGKLDEWPDDDKLERYTVISLRHCDVIEEFPVSIRCPRLRVFHVDNNDPHLKIPDNFFQQMKELRVLILTGVHLSPLPSSIRCLTKLRMLCLEQCTLGELRIIGQLKNLRILSFSGSDIESLPVELKHLSKLQVFDTSNCSKLRVIPPNVISCLNSLEELYMRNTLIQWRVDEGQESQSEDASLSELAHLNQLTNLDIQISSVAHLPKNLFFDKLHSYKIVIGSSNRYLETDFKMPEKYVLTRFLAIQHKDGFDIHCQKGIKMLFGRVENLLLEKLKGVQDIFYELNLKGFPCLEHLSIVSNSEIQYLINPKDRKHPEKAFPKLESLDLYKLKKMEEICPHFCQLSKPSFGKLKIIKIKLCGQLKNIFFISMVRLLTALETIQVSECNSLKGIVHGETQRNATEVELKFPELRSLTLQSLSEFIGFYPITPTEGIKALFHEKVVVSKLERMELSSIQINQIWIGQCSHFQNLICLDVNGCWNLTYLMSFTMAKNLLNLQSIFVSECNMMEHIFFQGEGSDAKGKDKLFPNLKNIKLSSMKRLSEIWNSKVPAGSFGKLDKLIIEKCNKFVNVFPHYMVEIFQSICSLRVTNCMSMKAIFDLADKKQGVRHSTNLQDVHLETLPKLEHVFKWKNDQEGILYLKNLQKLWVHDCGSLENLFPVFVAKTLEKLECLVIMECFRLREIVAKGQDGNNSTSSPTEFQFPKLTTIKFSKLPKFKNFYPGTYKLSCSELNDLSVELCDKLELFREETADASVSEETTVTPVKEESTVAPREYILFPEEAINQLKSMQIELRHAKSSTRYRRDNLEELRLSGLNNTDILFSFLHSNPNLKSLLLNDCFFEELVPLQRSHEIESLGVVPKLKSLKLTNLNSLKKIGFERDAILQRIELLVLVKCPRLATIAPPAVSLTHLTNLEVFYCEGLKYLMPVGTAKSLCQLSTMKVMNCASLEEIVSDQGREENEENAGKVDIIFRKLKALELISLKNLKSFCSSKSCVFEFPSLEKLIVSACPKMENFSQEVKRPPILQKIYVVHEKEKKRWCWEGNLQATIQKIFESKKFFESMDSLSVSDHLDLQEVWQGKKEGLQNLPKHKKDFLPKDWFYSLKTLKLENCKFEKYAIPSYVLGRLKSLKELKVRNCKHITIIFGMDDTKIRGTSFQLKKLNLEELPDVTNVWEQDNQGILSFQNLQKVTVANCKNLETLFPSALAKNLKKLEKLEIGYCDKLIEIVGKEKEAAEGTEKFVFPHLAVLELVMLPQLTYFYSERFCLECPELNCLQVLYCSKFELFQSGQEAHPEGHGSTSNIRQPLFLDIKGISEVENLYLNWKDTGVLRSKLVQSINQELKYLNQLYLWFDDDVNDSTLPFIILEKAPNLGTMAIAYCRSLKVIFPTENSNMGNGMLGNLKALFLFGLFELHSICGFEYLSKLQILYVYQCPCLKILVNPFSNLRELYICECHGLHCLFTFSAAKMLIHLEEMYVWDCESMKEIVEKEQNDEPATNEIKFERLERIALISLSSLKCFYSGSATLELPSLIQVDIVKCPKMKVFAEGSINAKSLRGIEVSGSLYADLVVHEDLNSTLGRLFLHKRDLVLGDYPELEEIWRGKPIPSEWSFSNMISLMVEGCTFLSNAVLPSHLLPSLSNLKELVVRKCDSVEAIFDAKDTPTHDSNMIVIPLKILTLEKLPSLRHVWDKDPKVSLSLMVLETVTVDGCESIKSLFPASVAKDNLQILNVRNCVELVEIFAKDEATTKEETKEIPVFPSLTSLTLWDLPKLRWICSGMQILDWPVLRQLDVYHCQMLKIFATDFQNSPDFSHPEGQDLLAADNHGFVSSGKVTPHLEGLALNKEDVIMIEQGLLDVDLQKIKFLKLQSFNDDSDVFPDGFFLKIPVPSMEVFWVIDSAFKEIFHSQRPDIDYYTKIFSQLQGLGLKSLLRLESLGFEHTWVAPLLENLQFLTILECSNLTNVAPSTVSFSHLSELNVKDCARLEHLFTSSTAISLVALNTMHIENCESLQKVVATEEGDKPEPNEDLIFTRLTTLSLGKLPKLGSFYTGNSTLNFPCLFEVLFSECKNMKTFSQGNVVPKVLRGKIDGVRWYGDMNTAVHQQFEKGSNPELA